MTYDLIKTAWQKATHKTWEDLYLDTFQAALIEVKPHLQKYVKEGDLTVDRQTLSKVLHQHLAVDIETQSYGQLSNDMFINKLANVMEAQTVLVIGGNELSQEDYSQLVHSLVRYARAFFKEAILTDEQAFHRVLLDETLFNQQLLRQVQDYLVNYFELRVLKSLETFTDRIEEVVTDVRDLKRIIAPIRYFMTLREYLTRPGSQFPKLRDFEKDLIYLPEKHISRIKNLLGETQRTLLIGRSGAGKTVLAISLAKLLQEQDGYQVFYRDVAKLQEGDGRAWYHIVQANDYQGVIYILDNCHLALEEVNEFCFQWEGMPPKHAQCLLISRLLIQELEAQHSGMEDYFKMPSRIVCKVRACQRGGL